MILITSKSRAVHLTLLMANGFQQNDFKTVKADTNWPFL